MQPFSTLPTPVRLSALFFVVARVGVQAQTPGAGASSICDGAVTVTWMPPPFTVTVYTTGTFNASDLIPGATSVDIPTPSLSSLPGVTSLGTSGLGTGLSSLPSASLGTSGLGSGLPTVSPTADASIPGSLSLSSGALPTSISAPSVPSNSLTSAPGLSITPSVSVPTVSMSLTAPSLTIPTTISPGGIPTGDPATGLTTALSSIDLSQSLLSSQDVGLPTLSSLDSITLPSLTLSGTSLSAGGLPTLSSLEISSVTGVSLPGNSIPSSLPTPSTPSITVSGPTLPTTSIPVAQLSSLSSALSGSVTLPAISLSSGLTTLIQSSGIPSLSLPTLSPSLPTLSSLGTLSAPSTSLAIPTGPSISLSSGTALPGLPSTSLSAALSSLSVSLPGGIPTLGPTPASTRTSSLATPIPTASVLALVYCPSDNGMNYLSPGDRAYRVNCAMRMVGDTLTDDPAPDLQSCMNSCDDISGCMSVTYNPADGMCSAKDEDSSGSPDSNFLSGTAIDMSCPGADTTQYMDYTGSVYQVMCDYVFPQSSNITTAPGDDYLDCSDTCSSTPTCTGFSYSDGICTFTQGFGNPPIGSPRNGTNTVVMLAKRAVRLGPDGQPIMDTIPVTSIPSFSLSGIYAPMTTSITALPSTFSPPSITSILTLPSTLSITTITSIDVSGLLNVTTNSLPSITSILTLPTITSIDASSILNATTISVVNPATLPSLSSFISSIINLPSATIPTSQGPTQTPISYTCPSSDGNVVVENGLSYVLNCNSTTEGTAYSSKEAASSFNDCFRECDQSSVVTGAKYCTAFTYEGAQNGAGMGTCYLYNGVSQGFVPSNGGNKITAIRAVNYVPGALVGGVSSLLSSVVPSLSVSIPLPGVSVSVTIAASVTAGVGVSVDLPSISIPLGGASTPALTSSLSSLVTLPASVSNPVTGTCNNGGNILNGCIDVTATLNPSVGVGGGVVLGPSSSPLLSLGVSASVALSVSAGVDLGVGLSMGSSGMSLGLNPSIGLGMSAGGGLGGGLGLGGGSGQAATTSSSLRSSATPGAGSPSATASTTSFYVTPMGPVVTTTTTTNPALSTTTVFTTSTITSCLTGLGGVLTCPIGGLFTTLPSTSGAVTSISTSTQTSVSVSVSVSISYITVTASSTSSPTSSRSSTFSTITTFSSTRTSSSSSSSTSTCRGVVNALGVCVL